MSSRSIASTRRPFRLTAFAVLCLVFIALPALLRGAAEPASGSVPDPPAGFALVGDASRGAEIYLAKCALCHGDDGSGKTSMPLDPPPRDLTDPDALKLDGDWPLYVVIRDGGTAVGLAPTMIGWKGQLTPQEIHDVAVFVRSLSED